MDSVDYTKSLNREQRKFHDQLEQSRDASSKEKARLENQAKVTSDKQKEVHRNQLNENEKNFNDRVETVSKDAKRIIEDKAKEFHKTVQDDRESFSKEKEEQVGRFNGKINNLADSYRKNADEQDKMLSQVRDNDRQLYSKKSHELARKHEKEMDEVYDKSNIEGTKLRDSLKVKQDKMSGEQKRQLDNINHEHYSKRAREIKDLRRSLNDINQNADELATNNQKHTRYNSNRLEGEKNQAIQETRNSFENAYQKSKQAHAKEKEDIVKEHKEEDIQQLRKFHKEKTAYEQEVLRKSGDDYIGQFNRELSESRHQDLINQKRDIYQSNLNQVQKQFNNEMDEVKDANAKGRRDDSISNAKTMEKKEIEFAINTAELMGSANKQKSLMTDAFIEKDKIKQETFDRSMIAEKDTSKSKYNNLKETFAASIQNLSDKNLKESQNERLRESEERSKLIQQNRSETNKIVGSIRKENLDKVNKSTNDYERRLEDVQQKMVEMQRFYEDKIAKVRQDATDAIDRQTYIHQEQRKNDSEFLKSQMAIREDELNRAIDDNRARHARELNTVAFEYERKMKTLNAVNDNKTHQLITDQDKERARLQNDMTREVERMKVSFEADRSRLVQQYENTIAKLKEAYVQKEQSVEEYKKDLNRTSQRA
jgi:hypothetical protein